MGRYVGVNSKQRICLVSDSVVSCPDYQVVEVPKELENLSASELMVNYRYRDGYFTSRFMKKSAKEMRVAFISNIFQACGISTYFENLFPAIIPHLKDYHIFAEVTDQPTGPLHDDTKITVCWKRGQPLHQLAAAIKQYNPDVVLLNHEWGIFPSASYFLSFLTQLADYRIITILHSVFPYHLDKTIVEGALGEIVVHLEGARQALIDKGIASEKISVIPHGCFPITNTERLWNFYRSEATFIQVGFGFQYKNFSDSIRACALLKDKWPDVFFTAIFSESPNAKLEHDLYFQQLQDLIVELGVENHVAIIRGFQSEKVIDAYLRTNKVAVYPYHNASEMHKVFGASGAARVSLAAQIPVISSSIPHFSDLPTIKINTAQELATELDKLFSDRKAAQTQVEKQNQFIQETSWDKVAQQYIGVLERK